MNLEATCAIQLEGTETSVHLTRFYIKWDVFTFMMLDETAMVTMGKSLAVLLLIRANVN
jgi:succinate-acetate transporter protein